VLNEMTMCDCEVMNVEWL